MAKALRVVHLQGESENMVSCADPREPLSHRSWAASVMDNGLAVAEKNGVAGGSALRRLALYVVKN